MRLSVAASVVSLVVMGVCAAADVEAAIKRLTNIPSQGLAPALRTLAKERNFQIVFATQDVSERHTAGAVGELTASEALEQILKGSGLSYRYVDEKTITILPVAEANQASPPKSASTGFVDGATRPDETDTSKDAPRRSFWDQFRLAQVDRESSETEGRVDNLSRSADSNSPLVAIEEVVVTAQKKSENIQDVPISMSAVTGETLKTFNATRLSDVAAFIPGMQVDSQTGQPGSTNVTLRGLSTASINSTTTATTIDDVPVGSSSAYAFAPFNGTDLLPFDLDHVEVLRGPQGTLYGANSLGGLVKYATPTPDLDSASFRVGAELSATDHSGSRVGHSQRSLANIPLIPGQLAINASASRVYTPGYIDNTAAGGERAYNDGKQEAARLSLLWRPVEALSARLMTLYNHSDFDGLGTVLFNVPAARPTLGYSTTNYVAAADKRTQKLAIAAVSYRFGWATLTSVTGYSDARGRDEFDISSNPFLAANALLGPGVATYRTQKWSEELRLASAEGERLQWMLGGFYTDEDTRYTELDRAIVAATGLPSATLDPLVNSSTPSTYKERAAFANARYELTQQWDVGAGLRYSENDQTFTAFRSGRLTGANIFTPPTSDHSTTFSVDSRYRVLPDFMVYARVASGYRPGGSNTIFRPDLPAAYAPDEVESYELGLKSDWMDGRLRVNLTGYYIDWTDIQISQSVLISGVRFSFVGNAGRAESKGAEFEVMYALTPGFKFGANGAYTRAMVTTDAPGLGAIAGDRLPYTPSFMGTLTADWTRNLGGDYALDAHAMWRFAGSRKSNFPLSQSGSALLSSYDVLDLVTGISRGAWRVNLFVRNVTGTQAFFSAQNLGAAILPPRSMGLGFEYSLSGR